MQKLKLDLGQSWASWTNKQDHVLLKSSLTVYRDKVLGRGEEPEVIIQFNKNNIIVNEGGRSPGAIETRTSKLLGYNPQFGTTIFYMNTLKLISVKEFERIDNRALNLFPGKRYKKEYGGLVEGMRSQIKKYSDHLRAAISLHQFGDSWLYTYPTDINADYAEIFWRVFELRKRWNKKTVEFFLWGLEQPNQKPAAWLDNVPCDKYFARSAAFYLLDFLLAQTANYIEEQSPDSHMVPLNKTQQEDAERWSMIFDKLKRFQQLSKYSNSRIKDIERAFSNKAKLKSLAQRDRENNKEIEIIVVALEVLDKLLQIDEETRKMSIPEFIIKMPSIFEIYVLSVFDVSVEYQVQCDDDRADIIDRTNKLVVECKYKYACLSKLDPEDAKKRKEYEEKYKMPAIIVYPILQETPVDNKKRILTNGKAVKVPFVFPRNQVKWRTSIPPSRQQFTCYDYMEYEEDSFLATMDH